MHEQIQYTKYSALLLLILVKFCPFRTTFCKIIILLRIAMGALLRIAMGALLRIAMGAFIKCKKSLGRELNPRPLPYQGNALARLSYQGSSL